MTSRWPRRTGTIGLLLATLLLLGTTSTAAAQAPSDPGLDELWERYPLDDGSRSPESGAGTAPAPAREPAPSAPARPSRRSDAARITYRDEAGTDRAGWLPVAGAAVVVLATLITVLFLRGRSRRGRGSGAAPAGFGPRMRDRPG